MNEIQRLQGLLFTLVPGETVRKGSEEPEVYPYGAPERYFSTHFGLRTPPQSTLRVLFVPLFGQFRKGNSAKLNFRYHDFCELRLYGVLRSSLRRCVFV